ncbi:hypothetical protein EWM64_g10055 [Hericium alpestre]|uniref:Reverse transcriptase Ty1/copia-type domain-containing protein n=1 Tax=Hericium alpestre TaxID=135208 RepID=A0A4Y9ZIU5_9AGAM|nr:hypothetical protein EWM64_g10055 [Hericium alpestre]
MVAGDPDPPTEHTSVPPMVSMPTTPPCITRAQSDLPNAPCPACMIKPSQYICLLQGGAGSTTGLLHVPHVPRSLQTEHRPLNFDTPGSDDKAAGEGDGVEPQMVDEAKASGEWPQWEAAIEDELARMKKMGMWELAEKPPGANVIGSWWVFKIKHNASGAIAKYKACLVAQGFSQIPGVDYTDTFAPVTKLSSIRILTALAARFD